MSKWFLSLRFFNNNLSTFVRSCKLIFSGSSQILISPSFILELRSFTAFAIILFNSSITFSECSGWFILNCLSKVVKSLIVRMINSIVRSLVSQTLYSLSFSASLGCLTIR
uniref:SJCHGC02672 protein n=1 Tax=Schistosoma japonicum TaxID=6182 RepID=Q5D9L9_SCHJA|nr:SJCHGC02672 protein [Schistosoma japonicum]